MRFGIDCKKLKSVNIPDSVTRISYSVFEGCASLEELHIPAGVKVIKGEAFSGTPWLEKEREKREDHLVIINGMLYDGQAAKGTVEIPDGVLTICPGAFEDSFQLKKVVIPKGVSLIGDEAFHGCFRLKKVEGMEDVKKIEKSAFEDCGSLTSIGNTKNVTFIGTSAFKDCDLKSVEFPKLKKMGMSILEGNANLKHVGLSDSLTELNAGCLAGTGIEEIKLPKKIKSIDWEVFADCTKLKTIDLPKGMWLGPQAFFGCKSLESINVPREEIFSYTFANCTNLKSVTFPSNLYDIRKYAFANCTGLQEITIPKSIKYIGKEAFCNCSNLTVRAPKHIKKQSEKKESFKGCKEVIYY